LRDAAEKQQAQCRNRIAQNGRPDRRKTGEQSEYLKISRRGPVRPQLRETALDQGPQQKAVEKIVLFAGHVSQPAAGKLRGADFALNMGNRTGPHPSIRNDCARAVGLHGSPEQCRADLPLVGNINHRHQPRCPERDYPQPALVEIDTFEFLIFLCLQHGEQQFLRRSAQLIDNFVIRQDAIGNIDDMVLFTRILHQITGAADIFRIEALLLHGIDFLQEGAVGYRAQEDIFLAAHPLRGLDLQIEQGTGEQRQQRDRAVSVKIVFGQGNQCEFHEYWDPER